MKPPGPEVLAARGVCRAGLDSERFGKGGDDDDDAPGRGRRPRARGFTTRRGVGFSPDVLQVKHIKRFTVISPKKVAVKHPLA